MRMMGPAELRLAGGRSNNALTIWHQAASCALAGHVSRTCCRRGSLKSFAISEDQHSAYGLALRLQMLIAAPEGSRMSQGVDDYLYFLSTL